MKYPEFRRLSLNIYRFKIYSIFPDDKNVIYSKKNDLLLRPFFFVTNFNYDYYKSSVAKSVFLLLFAKTLVSFNNFIAKTFLDKYNKTG